MKPIRFTLLALLLLNCSLLVAKPIELSINTSLWQNQANASTQVSDHGVEGASMSTQDTLLIDLQEAINIALSESPSVKTMEMEIEKKQYLRKSTKGALFPQIDAFGQYSRTIKKQTMYLDGDFPMGPKINPDSIPPHVRTMLEALGLLNGNKEQKEEGIQFGRTNLWTAGVSINMPLVAPVLWKTIELTSVDVEMALEEAQSSKQDLADGVTRAYYTVLLGEDSYNVFQEMYNNEKEILENIERKFKEGIVAEFDLITAQVRLQTMRPEMIQTKNALEMAKMQLKAMMGINLDIPLKVKGELSDYQEKMFAETLQLNASAAGGNEATDADSANSPGMFDNNSQLRKMDLQAKQLRKLYELKVAQFLPQVVASFKYNYMSQSNDLKFRDYQWGPFSTAEITVSIPIFSGGKRTNEKRAAKISVDQLAMQRIDVERKIHLAVKKQLSEIMKSIEQIQALKSTEEQAKRGYTIAVKRYETGTGTLLEVNQASLTMANVRLQKNNSIFSYLTARSELDKLLGQNVLMEEE